MGKFEIAPVRRVGKVVRVKRKVAQAIHHWSGSRWSDSFRGCGGSFCWRHTIRRRRHGRRGHQLCPYTPGRKVVHYGVVHKVGFVPMECVTTQFNNPALALRRGLQVITRPHTFRFLAVERLVFQHAVPEIVELVGVPACDGFNVHLNQILGAGR